LDTEPLIIYLENAEKPIKWKIDSPFQGGYIRPEDGVNLVFSSPNVDYSCNINIEATDNNENSAKIIINVIDEEIPPAPGDILINEIAWAGSLKSSYDEYLEILNTTDRNFYLNNWKIENAGGNGVSIVFSGLIKANMPFLITNYKNGSEKSSISVNPDFVTSKIALSNNKFGPYILKNSEGIVFDEIGDGGSYPYGINSESIKASMTRFPGSLTKYWDINSWYTEGISKNLKDDTLGTPGELNSNIPYGNSLNEEDAKGIIIKYYIDANNEVGEDWVELFISKSGDIKNFVLTDLDGEDHSITNGDSIFIDSNKTILVIWGDDYSTFENHFIIPDTNPTGTKDELVLLCNGKFLDGLCYYSTDDVQFDNDEEKIKGYGWSGNPIHSKFGTRKKISDEGYNMDLSEGAWDINNPPEP